LTNANLTNANLEGAKLPNNLAGVNLTGVNLSGRDLANANLTNANLTNANFTNANLPGTSILNGQEITKLTEWYGVGWKLLYKASGDGWKGRDFHLRCNNKGETVAVIRSTNNSIFGGYLGQSQNSNLSYICCDKASLFTLVSQHGIAAARFSVSCKEEAGYRDANYGPTFGSGHDIHVASDANSNSSSYSMASNKACCSGGILWSKWREVTHCAKMQEQRYPPNNNGIMMCHSSSSWYCAQ